MQPVCACMHTRTSDCVWRNLKTSYTQNWKSEIMAQPWHWLLVRIRPWWLKLARCQAQRPISHKSVITEQNQETQFAKAGTQHRAEVTCYFWRRATITASNNCHIASIFLAKMLEGFYPGETTKSGVEKKWTARQNACGLPLQTPTEGQVKHLHHYYFDWATSKETMRR